MFQFVLVLCLSSVNGDGVRPLVRYGGAEQVSLPASPWDKAYLKYLENMVMLPHVDDSIGESSSDFRRWRGPPEAIEMQSNVSPERFQASVNALTSLRSEDQGISSSNKVVTTHWGSSPVRTTTQPPQTTPLLNSFVPSSITIQGHSNNGHTPQTVQYQFLLQQPQVTQTQKGPASLEFQLPSPKINSNFAQGTFQNPAGVPQASAQVNSVSNLDLNPNAHIGNLPLKNNYDFGPNTFRPNGIKNFEKPQNSYRNHATSHQSFNRKPSSFNKKPFDDDDLDNKYRKPSSFNKKPFDDDDLDNKYRKPSSFNKKPFDDDDQDNKYPRGESSYYDKYTPHSYSESYLEPPKKRPAKSKRRPEYHPEDDYETFHSDSYRKPNKKKQRKIPKREIPQPQKIILTITKG